MLYKLFLLFLKNNDNYYYNIKELNIRLKFGKEGKAGGQIKPF